MKRTIRIVLANVGLAVALTACGVGATAGDTAADATPPAVSGANTSPGDAVPPAYPNPAVPAGAGDGSSAPATGGNDPARLGPGVMGQVTAVNGMQLTIQDQRQQSEATVALTDSTQIVKLASGDLASVPVGAMIMANGSQDGERFSATQIRIMASDTAAAGLGGEGGQSAPGGPGRPGGPGGPAPANASGVPDIADRLIGAVATAAADALTVATSDGTTVTVYLASDGQVVQQVTGSLADITVGAWVSAQGEPGDTALTAMRVEVMPEQPATP